MSQQSAAVIVPEVLYQNDLGREPQSHLELAQTQSTRIVALPIPQRKSGAELLPSMETLQTIERLANYVIKSNQFTSRFKNHAQVVVTLLKGVDLGISFADALEHVYVVNGKPGVSGQLMLRLIYSRVRNPKGEALVEFAEVGPTKATVRMRRPGQEWVKRSFTIDQAKEAGLLFKRPKDGGEPQKNFVWHAYREDMLLWRAVARCARVVFSDAIGGVYFYDELLSGPLNDPHALVPSQQEPSPKKSGAKKSKKGKKTKDAQAKTEAAPGDGQTKNGLSKDERDALQKSLHSATVSMDPDWPHGIADDETERFKQTRKLVYEGACQKTLEFVPEQITAEQAGVVGTELEARAERWRSVLNAVHGFAEIVRPQNVPATRREIWVEAWKAETGSAPNPKSLAAADEALAQKMLEGLRKNRERFEAQKKDGQEKDQ